MMAYEIRSETDLFDLIERIQFEPWEEKDVLFVDWPRLEITIRGEDFDGGVPTRIMPALLAFQSTLRHGYARAVYGVERRLTEEERRQTELIVRFEPGSTTFLSELWPVLNNALAAAAKKMSGTQAVVVILGIAAVAGGAYAWKTHVNYESERRRLEHQTRMSAEETERMGIIANLARDNLGLAAYQAEFAEAQNVMLRRMDASDRIEVHGEPIVDGATGRRIVRPLRPEPVHDRLDGRFIILSVESGRVRDGFRVRVRNVETRDELVVSIPEGTLPREQVLDLQSGEWSKQPLHMRINTIRIGRRIVRATLASAGLSSQEPR